ncbi:MAG: ankyrin repeat domain-containing protein, partial [Verrucomicrobiota bacterium]|nr:ankyrin repeat domain-containing protein [Verrucomicrobiota bacterium]
YEELGWNALEEKLAGTFDKDSEDTPYAPDQDEIESMLGLDVPGADSDNMTDQARLDEALGKVSYFYPRDELALRRVTIHRVIGENRQRSLFDRVIADDSGVWQRLRPTGLIHNTTDPRTGFSTLKWMELLNYSGDATFLAKDTLKDGANRRLQFRLSSTRTYRDGKSILHQFIRGGDKYEIAFAVSQTKGVDQRDQRGRTALHVAAALGSLDTVKVLLELGANPAVGDDYGFNALHWAAQQGRMEVAKHLVEQAGLKPVQDRLHRTPAALAKANGHAAVSEYLEAQ